MYSIYVYNVYTGMGKCPNFDWFCTIIYKKNIDQYIDISLFFLLPNIGISPPKNIGRALILRITTDFHTDNNMKFYLSTKSSQKYFENGL